MACRELMVRDCRAMRVCVFAFAFAFAFASKACFLKRSSKTIAKASTNGGTVLLI
jgi:hypothetical protein